MLTLAVPTLASAQTLSGIQSASLSASLAQSLSISITSGSSVNFTLAENAAADGDVPVVVSSTWNLNPGQTGAVSLYGYFDVPASALTDGGSNSIPTSWVEGRMTTGTPTSYTAFSQTNAVGPATGSQGGAGAPGDVASIAQQCDALDRRRRLAVEPVELLRQAIEDIALRRRELRPDGEVADVPRRHREGVRHQLGQVRRALPVEDSSDRRRQEAIGPIVELEGGPHEQELPERSGVEGEGDLERNRLDARERRALRTGGRDEGIGVSGLGRDPCAECQPVA